jgi:hypothetical protein
MRCSGASLTDSADRVIAIREKLWTNRAAPPPVIIVDEPGVGGGAIDVLRKKGWRIKAFNVAARANDPRRFLNARAETHWKLRELLENNRIALPRSQPLEEEALAVEWQLARTAAPSRSSPRTPFARP